MSAIIMANIKPTRERLKRYVDEAAAADFTINRDLIGAEKMARCESIKKSLESFIEKIERAINLLESANWRWAEWMGKLPIAQKEDEKTVFDNFSNGDEGHLKLMETGRESLNQLYENLRILNDLM
jgi:hypothetical protein